MSFHAMFTNVIFIMNLNMFMIYYLEGSGQVMGHGIKIKRYSHAYGGDSTPPNHVTR